MCKANYVDYVNIKDVRQAAPALLLPECVSESCGLLRQTTSASISPTTTAYGV